MLTPELAQAFISAKVDVQLLMALKSAIAPLQACRARAVMLLNKLTPGAVDNADDVVRTDLFERALEESAEGRD
jgi:hypothetical protein